MCLFFKKGHYFFYRRNNGFALHIPLGKGSGRFTVHNHYASEFR